MNIVYYQNPKHKNPYRFFCIILGFFIVTLTVVGALGTVFFRQEVMKKADQVKTLEVSLDKVERRNNYLAAKIAQVHTPEYLVGRASSTLSTPQKGQVVWIKADGTPTQIKPSRTDAFSHTLELALIESKPAHPIQKQ